MLMFQTDTDMLVVQTDAFNCHDHDTDRRAQLTLLLIQTDVVWESLSSRETLSLFASIKGLPAERLRSEVRYRAAT
eukprot:3910199-Rhodomonas_salina.1